MLPLYVVNLDRAPERWEKISAQLTREGLTPTRFAAIDGSLGQHEAVSRYDERAALRRHCLPLLPAELGCFASHYLLWQRVLESGTAAIVLEDDLRIDPGFANVVRLAEDLAQRYPAVRLSALRQGRTPRFVAALDGGYRLVRHNKGPLGTQGYMVTPEGAAGFLANGKVWSEPVDFYMDAFWRHEVAALEIVPYRITHDDGQSFIRPPKPLKRSPGTWLRYKLNRRMDRLRAYWWLTTHPPRGEAARNR